MSHREKGFTLIEIMVVISIIAVLSGMVAMLIPVVLRWQERTVCQNNLMEIGGMLKTLETAGRLERRSGAAFLLQIKDRVNDEDLDVFVCPGDTLREAHPEFPRPGSVEFIEGYRDLDLSGDLADHWTSYAGPNWKDFRQEKAGRKGLRTRLWACDRCEGHAAHHDGLAVLYSSGRTGFLELADLEGHSAEDGKVHVGPESPDPRLAQMVYFPPR